MQQVTFEDKETLTPLKTATRRVGKPRFKWIDYTMEIAWKRTTETDAWTGNEEQRKKLREHAEKRNKPFDEGNKNRNRKKGGGRRKHKNHDAARPLISGWAGISGLKFD